MDHTEQTIHPAVLTAAEPAFGPGWLLLARTPKGPAEERVLGTRAVLISLVGATVDQLQRVANETLNLYDNDASASPAERARRALAVAPQERTHDVAQSDQGTIHPQQRQPLHWPQPARVVDAVH